MTHRAAASAVAAKSARRSRQREISDTVERGVPAPGLQVAALRHLSLFSPVCVFKAPRTYTPVLSALVSPLNSGHVASTVTVLSPLPLRPGPLDPLESRFVVVSAAFYPPKRSCGGKTLLLLSRSRVHTEGPQHRAAHARSRRARSGARVAILPGE